MNYNPLISKGKRSWICVFQATSILLNYTAPINSLYLQANLGNTVISYRNHLREPPPLATLSRCLLFQPDVPVMDAMKKEGGVFVGVELLPIVKDFDKHGDSPVVRFEKDGTVLPFYLVWETIRAHFFLTNWRFSIIQIDSKVPQHYIIAFKRDMRHLQGALSDNDYQVTYIIKNASKAR